MKKLVITITKGIRTIQAEGMKGQGCEALVTGLAKKLGQGRELKNEHTAEYYEQPIAAETLENR